jgi:hypothetical protein
MTQDTQAIFYNWKPSPVQRMLDFDFICGRSTPSVACVVQPGSAGFQKVFFGKEEIAIPVSGRYWEFITMICSPCESSCDLYNTAIALSEGCYMHSETALTLHLGFRLALKAAARDFGSCRPSLKFLMFSLRLHRSTKEAAISYPKADVFINFASQRRCVSWRVCDKSL